MKVITAYPIIVKGKVVGNKLAANTLNFSSANGDQAKKGDKVKKAVAKAKEAGLGDAALKTIKALTTKEETAKPAPAPVPTPVREGMSNATKIALGVGAAAVLGIGIYFISKK